MYIAERNSCSSRLMKNWNPPPHQPFHFPQSLVSQPILWVFISRSPNTFLILLLLERFVLSVIPLWDMKVWSPSSLVSPWHAPTHVLCLCYYDYYRSCGSLCQLFLFCQMCFSQELTAVLLVCFPLLLWNTSMSSTSSVAYISFWYVPPS